MLLGIDPRLTPDLLYSMSRMGHGDEILVADSNFPSEATAAHCVFTRPIHLPGLDAAEVIDAITTLMPLDPFISYAALRMEVDGSPEEMTEAHKEVWEVLTPRLPEGAQLASIERQAFYVQARKAFAVVQCGEARPFGCFILRKGVVF